MIWGIVYEKSIREDGTAYFEAKLSLRILEDKKRAMGSYIFSNQYLNEIIPAEFQSFKRDWFKYYDHLPKRITTFVFVDPAISQADTADFTGVVVVSVDAEKQWYVRYARRHKITPTEIINLLFKLAQEFDPNIVGIEDVAYQKALLYFLDEEMRRRNILLPVKGVKPPTDKTKQMRILGLVPRFEFGRVSLEKGLTDLELELLKFPRGAHDDLADALAGIEYIYYAPDREKKWDKRPSPNHPQYEEWYRQNMHKADRDTDPGIDE